jgi:hypothetical protein
MLNEHFDGSSGSIDGPKAFVIGEMRDCSAVCCLIWGTTGEFPPLRTMNDQWNCASLVI